MAPTHPTRHWTVFCRVIDNLGDAGVCWRLSVGLAARGQRVRLVIDDVSPLAFMAPHGAAGVEVLPWPGPGAEAQPGDVVIEAFGCDPPPCFVEAMGRAPHPPLWINLEYLSAEDWVERAHGLPSPQHNGLTKWFLFPGFAERTLGLLREAGAAEDEAGFDGRAWLAAQGWPARPDERVVLLFCYANPALPALVSSLGDAPTLLLLPPGPVQNQLGALATPSALRLQPLPWLPQTDFDRLLRASDLNVVRGEDSLVRALWAGRPMVWQAYPQHDGVHEKKLEALLARLRLPPEVATLWRAWNGFAPWPGLPPLQAWQPALAGFRAAQRAQPDLVTQLLGFVAGKTQG
jgi:uncharacterized repeat protein (TIGR03837 family)